MKRALRLAVMTLLIVVPATIALAGNLHWEYRYFSDGTYTTQVGLQVHECGDPVGYYTSSGNTSTSWRRYYVYQCPDGQVNSVCQELIDGVWTNDPDCGGF